MSETITLKNKKTGKIITIRRKVKKEGPVGFYKKLGAEITPALEKTHPYLSAIAKTGQDMFTVPAHFFNQFLLNLPRAGLRAAGMEFPKAESPVAKMAARGAGVTGAVVGGIPKIIQKVGAKAAGAIPALAGKGVIRAAGRGAVGGAVAGATYTPTEADIPIIAPKERLIQAGFGAILGGIFGGVFEAGAKGKEKGAKWFRKLKYKEKVPVEKRVGYQIKDVGKLAEKQQAEIKRGNEEARRVIKDNIKILDDDLQRGAEGKSLEYQKKLPKLFRNNGEAYGSRLDDTSNDLIKRKVPFKILDTDKVIRKTISESEEAFIDSGPAIQALNKLKTKYGIISKERVSPVLTERGQPFRSEIITNSNKPVNLQEFVNDIRNVSKALSASAKRGERFAQEDIAVAILNKNFGELVAQKAPVFKQLQTAYRPVVQAMKEAGKVFKPYAGEFKTTPGVQLLKKAALKKLGAPEQKMLKLIESGTEFAPGIGKISEPILKTGQKILTAKENLKAISDLQKLGIEKIKAAKLVRLAQLETRRREVAELVVTKQRAQRIRKKLLYGAGAIGGIGGGAYGASRILKKIPETIGGGSKVSEYGG